MILDILKCVMPVCVRASAVAYARECLCVCVCERDCARNKPGLVGKTRTQIDITNVFT